MIRTHDKIGKINSQKYTFLYADAVISTFLL